MTEIDNIIKEISPYYKKKKEPSSEHELVYDISTESLEPVYFWILDFMNGLFGGNVEKITDNFSSSPGSGYFSETQGKIIQMQQQATSIMVQINTLIRSVMNLIYDLKEFEILLKQYEDANSNDKSKSEAGVLALKQRWMDKVDILRGNGSINALATGNLQFVTLRDFFMTINSAEEVDSKDLDANDRVKRILKPRIEEFIEWQKRSEQELTKKLEIEKSYLKSQVKSLKLYTRWAKPYLKAAQQLEANEKLGSNPALVNVFNVLMLELTLMGTGSINIENAVLDKELPKDFKKMKLRKYHPIVFVDFNFRSLQRRIREGFIIGGRADVSFKSYALNEDELLLLKDKLDQSDLNDSLKLIQGMTDESLAQLQEDLEKYMEEDEDEEKEEKEERPDNINPFSALFSFIKPRKKEKESKDEGKEKLKRLKEKGIKSEGYHEQYVRNLAEAEAINKCYTVFDIYKKAHGMASLPYRDDAEAESPQTGMEKAFGFK